MTIRWDTLPAQISASVNKPISFMGDPMSMMHLACVNETCAVIYGAFDVRAFS
ncbi:hypothetical protein VSR34_21720 [Paraburkholderia sp. JHI2823]|uniref:hypothetical protein n=1 Tax=Paraburkholderia sp. JHI2823 TaxID=3112960 RepID=UPI00316E2E01